MTVKCYFLPSSVSPVDKELSKNLIEKLKEAQPAIEVATNPNFTGMCTATLKKRKDPRDEKDGGKEVWTLLCEKDGLVFFVPLPGLPEFGDDYDEGQCLRNVARTLDGPSPFQKFAQYSPLLIGLLTTGQEPSSQRDIAARLRLIDLLIAGLRGRESYQGVYWLLLRQRFVLLAMIAAADKSSETIKYLKENYLLPFDYQLNRAHREWAYALIQQAEHMVPLLTGYCRQVDIEHEGKQLVLKDEKVLWSFLTGNERDQTLIDYVVSKWFLRRYDLQTATQVVGQAIDKQGKVVSSWLFRWRMPYLAVGISTVLFVTMLLFPLLPPDWQFLSRISGNLSLFLLVLLGIMTVGAIRGGRMVLYPFALRLPAAGRVEVSEVP